MASTYDFRNLSPYRYVSTSGVVIPDTTDIQDEVVSMFKAVFGQNIDTTPETIIGRLIDAFTVFLRDTVGITAQNACQFNLNVATGIYLDALGALFGVSRNSSFRSSVTVILTGDVKTTIPAGTMFATRDGDAFYLDSYATIPSVEEGAGTGKASASGTALSMNYGPVKCLRGDMVSIVSPISGLDSVTNANDATIGSLGESDDSYRNRIRSAIGGFGGMVPSVYKELYAATYIDGTTTKNSAKHVLVLNNGDGIASTQREVTLAPHSIFVCVDGPSGYASNDTWKSSIADAVAKSKSLGCATTYIQGSIQQSADSELGGITVNFYVAQPQPITVVSTWSNGITTDQISNYQETLEEIISGFGIGATITSEQVLNSLALAYPTLRVLTVTLNGGSSVSLNGKQIGTVAT
jgi:hypothetical protein